MVYDVYIEYTLYNFFKRYLAKSIEIKYKTFRAKLRAGKMTK